MRIGCADQQRDMDDGVVQLALVVDAVVEQVVAVVRGVDDDGIVEQSLAFEPAEDLADLLVDHGQAGVVVLAQATHPLRGGVAGLDDGHAVAVLVAPHFGEQLVGHALEFFVGDVGHGDGVVVVLVDEALRRVVRIVRAEEADVQVERFFAFPAVDPLEGAVADEDVGVEFLGQGPDDGTQFVVEVGVGLVQIVRWLVPGLLHGPVPVARLAIVHERALVPLLGDALVEAGGRQVGLADAGAVVAAVAQTAGPVEATRRAVETVDAGVVRVEPGVEGGPAGDAGGRRAERVGEDHAAVGQAVEVRGAHPVGAGAVHGVAALLLGGDEEDVGSAHAVASISLKWSFPMSRATGGSCLRNRSVSWRAIGYSRTFRRDCPRWWFR